MDLIDQATGTCPCGSATWMAQALKVEEAQVLGQQLHRINARDTESKRLQVSRRQDKLQSQINGLVQTAAHFLGSDWDNGLVYPSQADRTDDIDDFFSSSTPGDAEAMVLPLPSYLGLDRCWQLGLDDLANQELQLRQGQANDSLHEMRLALADKAVLYRMDVRHGRNYNMTMRAWKKAADMEAIVR